MTDIDSIRSDLAFMRAMADDGRAPSPQGGLILAAGGFVFGAASFVAWALLAGALPGGAAAVWIPWLAASLVFAVVLATSLRAIGKGRSGEASEPGFAAVAGMAWAALGGAMFTLIAAAVAANLVTGSPAVWSLIPSVFIALYGAGWTIACVASGRGWMRSVALASFAASVLMACLSGSPLVYLAYGVALILLGGVPGLLLARAPAASAPPRG